jgi:hypothetical protein
MLGDEACEIEKQPVMPQCDTVAFPTVPLPQCHTVAFPTAFPTVGNAFVSLSLSLSLHFLSQRG